MEIRTLYGQGEVVRDLTALILEAEDKIKKDLPAIVSQKDKVKASELIEYLRSVGDTETKNALKNKFAAGNKKLSNGANNKNWEIAEIRYDDCCRATAYISGLAARIAKVKTTL